MSFELTTIGQYASVQGGYAFKSQDFSTSGFRPVLKIKNVRHGYIDYGDVAYVSEDIAKACQRWETASGDILISMTGSGPNAPESLVGRVARVWGSEPKSLINQRVGRLVLKGDLAIDKDFLFYVLSQRETQEYLVSNSTGSANQVNINAKTIESVSCPNVSFEESRKIASILKCLDQRIRLLRETNTTLEAIAQALFKSWFVDFDPVHANAGTQAPSLPAEIQALFPSRLVESPQGLIPEGWEWGAISDYAKLNPESWTAKKHPATVAYIDLANAKDNVIADIAEFVFADAPSRARRVLKDRDTIVGTVRPGNRSFAFIYDAASNLTGSTGFAVLRPKHPSNTAFIYLAATNDSSIDHLTHVADGGAYPAVRPDVVAGLTCVRAPADVLEAFNEVSEELLCKISKNHSLAQTLSDLRDTLLPRLISGQLRLPEAEVALAEV